jgi:hypothetical protein
LTLSNRPDCAIVLGRIDAPTGRDTVLGSFQLGRSGVQVLQRNHGAAIGINAVQGHFESLASGTAVPFWNCWRFAKSRSGHLILEAIVIGID